MQATAPIVRRILIAWGVLWVLSFLTALGSGPGLSGWLELDPLALLRGDLTGLAGVLGYALVHDPYGILHVAVNAWMFHLFAPEVETLYRRRFVRMLVASALAGAAVTLLLAATPMPAFDAAVVGGSGLVATMLAVNAAIYPDRRLNLIVVQPRLIVFFAVLVGLDLLGFIAQCAGRGGGVATQVHLAGAAVGWFWADGFARLGWRDPLTRWRSSRREAQRKRRASQAADDEAELDRILAKISREGLPSLSAKERDFLEKRSRDRD
jgi:membrane associated rhomboid family serine protease